MEKEFNLSERIVEGEFHVLAHTIREEHVKEFIKLLKERLPAEISIGVIEDGVLMQHDLIDKLAGSKLI